MNKDFEGKVVLITGSARGIGRATAKLAHHRGATVVLHGRSESKHLEALSKELNNALMITCDVADKEAVTQAVNRVIQKFGKVDVLVNSAGIAMSMSFLETDDEHWLEIFKVNVLGTVHFCQAVIPFMEKQSYGRIVNVASIRGHEVAASNERMSYSISKASISNLTASLAKKFAPNIAVNAVSPGFTYTDISKEWNEHTRESVNTALKGRGAQPEEIAEPILFLGSDAAGFITGQTLVVDGGYTIAGK